MSILLDTRREYLEPVSIFHRTSKETWSGVQDPWIIEYNWHYHHIYITHFCENPNRSQKTHLHPRTRRWSPKGRTRHVSENFTIRKHPPAVLWRSCTKNWTFSAQEGKICCLTLTPPHLQHLWHHLPSTAVSRYTSPKTENAVPWPPRLGHAGGRWAICGLELRMCRWARSFALPRVAAQRPPGTAPRTSHGCAFRVPELCQQLPRSRQCCLRALYLFHRQLIFINQESQRFTERWF